MKNIDDDDDGECGSDNDDEMDLILWIRLCHLHGDDDSGHMGKECWQPNHPLTIVNLITRGRRWQKFQFFSIKMLLSSNFLLLRLFVE